MSADWVCWLSSSSMQSPVYSNDCESAHMMDFDLLKARYQQRVDNGQAPAVACPVCGQEMQWQGLRVPIVNEDLEYTILLLRQERSTRNEDNKRKHAHMTRSEDEDNAYALCDVKRNKVEM